MRIRSIKPEFWRSDAVNAMCIEDRLLFIGLWSYVDDNGVGVDRVSDVCADLFAHDLSVSPHGVLTQVAGGLNRLHALGVIERYSVGGKRFLEVSNWSEHQRINRPSPGRYPRSDDPNAEIHAPLTEDSLRTHADALPGAGEQGNRGTGEQTTTARERARAPRESSSTFADGTPIPPEPPHDSDEHVVVAEIVPTEIGTASTPRTPKPSPAHKTTVRTILGGAGYPDTTITQLATQVGKLAGKHDAELIAEALREWDRRPDVKPAFLGSVLGDVVKARRARPDQPKSKLRALAELANEERSRENDHQPNRKELA